MKRLSFLLLLIPVFADITCPTAPIDVTQVNNTLDLTALPPNFECSFKFKFANEEDDWDLLSIVDLNAYNIGADEIVQLTSKFDQVRNTAANFSFNLAIPPPTVTIYVKTGSQTTMQLQFSVASVEYDIGDDSTSIEVDIGTGFQILQINSTTASAVNNWMIDAANNATVTVNAPPGAKLYNLMNFFVFVGVGEGAAFLGTLYGLLNNVYTVSNPPYLIYYANPVEDDFVATILANDLPNLADCESYSTQWSYGNPVQSVMTPDGTVAWIDTVVDATKGPACLTILNEMFYAQPFNNPYFVNEILNVDDNTKPIVVAGPPVASPNETILGTLANPASFSLPQYFDGGIRTIMLDKGILHLGTTTDPKKAPKITEATVGRKGFLMSHQYPFDSVNVGSDQLLLQKDTPFTFTFTIVASDARTSETVQLNGASTPLTIISLADKTNVGQSFSFTDTKIVMVITAGVTPVSNTGTYITYSIRDPLPSTISAVTPSTTRASRATGTTPDYTGTDSTDSSYGTTETVPQTTTKKSAATITAAISTIICSWIFL